MVDQRLRTYEPPGGDKTGQEGPVRSYSGASWLFGIVLLIAVLATGYLMVVRDNKQGANDAAIAAAAHRVGAVAREVGIASGTAGG